MNKSNQLKENDSTVFYAFAGHAGRKSGALVSLVMAILQNENDFAKSVK